MLRRKLLLKAFHIIDKLIGNDDLETTPQGILDKIQVKQPVSLEYEDPDVSDEEFNIPDDIYPYYTIKKTDNDDYRMYFEPILSQMIQIKTGTTVVRLHDKPDKRGRILVYTPNYYLVIPEDELVEIGYN